MPRPCPVAMLVAFILPTMAQLPTMARAADLDQPYHRPHRMPRGHLPARPPIVEDETVVEQRVVVVHDRPLIAEVPIPAHVGGAFIYVPGLNGPLGPPVYPLLPFAFGYGY